MTDSCRANDKDARVSGHSEQNTAGETKPVLTDIVDSLRNSVNGKTVTVGDVVDRFEDRGIGALCTIIALIASFPLIGAIPGVSVLSGVLLVLCACQYLFGRKSPWVPPYLRRFSIATDKMKTATEKARPYVMWMDRHIKPRGDILVAGDLPRRFIAFAICLLALTMFPLALVPWGVQAPAAAVVFFGIAIIGRDGLYAALGYGLTAATAVLFYYFSDTITELAARLTGNG